MITWAASLPASVFAELLLEIKDSRRRCLAADNNEPAEGTLAATLTKAVDAFDEAVESRGWGFNEELMLLAGHDDDAERLVAPAAATAEENLAFGLDEMVLDEEEEEEGLEEEMEDGEEMEEEAEAGDDKMEVD